jgi:hypothetical protein
MHHEGAMMLNVSAHDSYFLRLAIPRSDSECIRHHYMRLHPYLHAQPKGIVDSIPLLLTDPVTSDFINAFVEPQLKQQALEGLSWYLLISEHANTVLEHLSCCFTYITVTWRPGIVQRNFLITLPEGRQLWLINNRANRHTGPQPFPLLWSITTQCGRVCVSQN